MCVCVCVREREGNKCMSMCEVMQSGWKICCRVCVCVTETSATDWWSLIYSECQYWRHTGCVNQTVNSDPATMCVCWGHQQQNQSRCSMTQHCGRPVNVQHRNNTHTLIKTFKDEFWKCWDVFLNLNKMKTKRISNHMSQYFIHNRT